MRGNYWSILRSSWIVSVVCALLLPARVAAQTWTWTTERVDRAAQFTSLAVDQDGNVHVAYAGAEGSELKYAFRDAVRGQWFTMVLDKQLGTFATGLDLDSQGNPHICYTPRQMKYAHWDGKRWHVEQIAPGQGTVEYNCSVFVSRDDTAHFTWYQTRSPDGGGFLHIRYASFEDGVWVARTIDFDREAGKWNSVVVDANGRPHIAYSVFPPGALKYSFWDGTKWNISEIDVPRTRDSTGMGASLAVSPQKELYISYYEASISLNSSGVGAIKLAHQTDKGWKIETIGPANKGASWAEFNSRLAFDLRGFPHVCYEDGGSLKHAYWDGAKWIVQLVVPGGAEYLLYSSMRIAQDDTVYMSFRDPLDGSLRVAIGRLQRDSPARTASSAEPLKK